MVASFITQIAFVQMVKIKKWHAFNA